MMKKYTIGKRILAMLLCIAMLAAWLPTRVLPVSAVPAGTYSTTVDPDTLDQWKLYFGEQENHAQDVALSTEFAGGVWTDKSVFKPSALPTQLTGATYNNTGISVADKGDNFLVALSAMASNKQIKGYSTIPTDTVLVLDLSSSMRYTDDDGASAVDELVAATNQAISDLLALNKNNRVAVVVYAGNTNKSFSTADGITQVVMPLDSYTTDQAGVYLQIDPLQVEQTTGGRYPQTVLVPNTNPYGLAVYDGVTGTADQSFRENSFEVATGTFMQDGIYEAMRVLLGADPVVSEGVQAGTARMPIMVLMSDGEPTLATNDYNGNDTRTDLGTSVLNNYGSNTNVDNNTTYTNRDLIAFTTSLTAAFAKNQMEAHYDNKSLIYTLAYGDTVLDRDEARSVLDPANASDVQNDLWDRFLDGDEVRVGSYTTGSGWNTQTRYYTTRNSSLAAEMLTQEDRIYVEKYFPAGDDDGMSQAFAEIVNQIIIQSKYYPTYVEGSHDHDGYLTFVDKLGEYMQIGDVEGIVIGNRLFSGAALASSLGSADDELGTVDKPTAAGDELIRSVKERLGIADTATAQALVASAYNNKQLYYESDTEFSHYIGWFADADGNYVDFWHEGMEKSQYDADAAYIMKSYGFLGDTSVVPGVSNTDMMYMTVRVATNIATGESIITWKIPASLIPTITYLVDVNVNEDGVITDLISLEIESGTAESPIRLLYEVELREDIQDWNITEKIPNPEYTTNKDAGYVFYTNKWMKPTIAADDPNATDAEKQAAITAAADDTTRNTYSHFEPSVENERYYYNQDTLVYADDQGTVYSGAKPSGEGFYHVYQVFEELNNGTLRIHEHYEPITAQALAETNALVALENGQWAVRKGVVHRYYDYEITEKTTNATGTMGYSDHPFVVKQGNTYYTYSTQGNNGKLLVTPATGIKLTKTLADGFTTDESFTFVLSGGDITNAELVRLDNAGNEASREALSATGEFTLAAGETVYIVGLTEATYTVAEQIPAGAQYHVAAIDVEGTAVAGTQADVTLTAQNISEVKFVNDEKRHGSLIVSKDVIYPQGFAPADAHDNKTFTIQVAFTGDLENMPTPAGAVKNGNTYTLSLRDTDSVTFTGIPAGVSYSVSETGLTAGYTNEEIVYTDTTGIIAAEDADQVHVINTYAPDPADINVKVEGTKTVVGTWPAGAEFTVKLLMVTDFSSGQVTDTGLSAQLTATQTGYTLDLEDMANNPFTEEGTYYFRVVEQIPDDAQRVPNMAYDRTYGLFAVTVTEQDADGKLEISNVQSYQDTGLSGDAASGWTLTKDFTNVVTEDIVYLDIQKNIPGGQDHLADITFGLFSSMDPQAAPEYYVLTDGAGKATIAVPVTKDGLGASGKVYYYLREIAPAVENRIVGMTYNKSWIYAIEITWDDVNHKAVVRYAQIVNDVIGAYTAYDRAAFVFQHTNTYNPNVSSTPEIILSGQKLLNGNTDLGGRVFDFEIYDADAAFNTVGAARETVQNQGNSITFSGISYDSPGLKRLIVREKATNYGGVSIDTAEYHITVLIEKYAANDGTTKLRVAGGYPHIVKYGTTAAVEADALNFNNTYTVTGSTSVTIDGTKTLSGRPMLNGEFHFALEQVANAKGDAIQNGTVLYAENGPAVNGEAQFEFQAMEYTTEGIYYYKLTEIASTQNLGITYSDAVYIAKVVISDNDRGGLKSEWNLVDENDQVLANQDIRFINYYTPADLQVSLRGVKTLEGKELEAGAFSFTITKTQADFATVIKELETVTNDIRGEIIFKTLTFSEKGNGYEPGSHYFVIREQIPAQPAGGIVYDTTEFHVTVTVEDAGQGQLTEKISIVAKEVIATEGGEVIQLVPADSIAFDNRYEHSGTVPVTISGEKKLTGKTMEAEEFTFELYDEKQKLVGTAVNDEQGKFSFANVELDAVGTYTYTVKEKNSGAMGMTYDSSVYTVTVAVSDNGQGGLNAQTEITLAGKAAEIVFNNSFQAQTVTVELDINKTVKSETVKDVSPEGYEFLLVDENGKEQGRVKSDKLGDAKLSLQFSQEQLGKTFKYRLSEVDTKKTGVVYSDAVYAIEITLVEDSKGNLAASLKLDGKQTEQISVEFINRFEEAATPQTGDSFNAGLFIGMMVVSSLALAVLIIGRKKETA